MLQNNVIEPAMHSVLSKWYDFMEQHFNTRPDAIGTSHFPHSFPRHTHPTTPCHLLVYLSIPPAVAHSRMLSRGRIEEATVPLDYLTQLDRLHDTWLSREQEANMNE